jgi:actin-related protein
MKNKQARFCLLLTKWALSIHVTNFTKLAIVQLLANSLSKVDIELRNTLYNEIVLSGGNTMFEGLPERFIKELRRVLPNEIKTRVLAPAKRDTMCWEGGSILASLPSFKNMWITRAEYN